MIRVLQNTKSRGHWEVIESDEGRLCRMMNDE